MEREARAAGARIERRDGWNVALGFDGDEPERRRCESTVGFADRSHLGKLELQAGAADLAQIVAAVGGGQLELGTAARESGAWWCPYTPNRALVLCEPGEVADLRTRLEQAAEGSAGPASVLDVTTVFAALTVAGPLSGELFARFSAIDLRPAVMPVHAFRPVSVARTPGTVLREGEQRYLMLFGAALGSYMWTVVADAAASLGGGPVGLEALGDA
jgi:heterotetrameric sarcosine oxidase gamma subunit